MVAFELNPYYCQAEIICPGNLKCTVCGVEPALRAWRKGIKFYPSGKRGIVLYPSGRGEGGSAVKIKARCRGSRSHSCCFPAPAIWTGKGGGAEKFTRCAFLNPTSPQSAFHNGNTCRAGEFRITRSRAPLSSLRDLWKRLVDV